MNSTLIFQQSMQKLFDKGSSVLFRWRNDASWSIDYVSENVQQLLGYSHQEFLQEKITYAKCIHPDFMDQIQNEVATASKDGSDFFQHKPYKIVTKEKREKWVLDQTVLVKNENGEITHYVGYINDITKSVELTHQNEILQQRVQLAVESTNDGIWDWNLETGEVFFSRQWKSMLGYADEEIQNNAEAFFNLIHPDDKVKTETALEKHFQNSKTPYKIEIRLLCKDGDYKWILSRGKAIFDANNKPLRMIGSHIDIDRNKKVLEQLSRLNKRFTNMFKNHHAIMLLIEPKSGKILDANVSAQKFYGYSLKEFTALTIDEINIASAEEIAKNRAEALQNNADYFVFEHKKKNGDIATVEANISVIETEQGSILFSIIMDVTKEKENEKQLKKVFNQLQQAQKIAKIGLWELHHENEKLEWSDEIFNIFEIDKDTFDASYEAFVEAIHPDDREEVHSAYINSLKTKEPYEITHRLLMPDGRIKYVLEQCDTEFDKDGSPLLSRGTVQDITEFTMLDATVRSERKRFKTFMDNASDGILIINQQLKLVDYSKVAKHMLGYSDEEMHQLHITDWDLQLDAIELKELISKFSEKPSTFETIHKRKDGTTYNASITAVLMDIEGEKFIYAAMRDISEVKKLQDTILYEKNFIETIIESSNAIIAVIDSQGRMIKLNSYGENFTGYTQEEIAEEPYKWKCFLPVDIQESVVSIVENAKEGNIIKSYQNEWHSKSGEIKMFEWSNTLVKKEDGSMDYIATIGIDITQEQEQQAFLKLLINSQSHMIMLADANELKYVNKALLDFFDVATLETMQLKYSCICNTFIENDFSFHLGTITDNKTWIDAIQILPTEKQVVSIHSIKENKERTFKVNIEHYSDSKVYLLTFIDISDTMTKQLELEYKSHHDSLTKAYNRAYFYENYASIIASYAFNNKDLAIAMIDIDHFKAVNDTYGHDVGDEVLKSLVQTIQTHSRESDTLIRWGGEEFILLIPINHQANLYKILDSLRKTIENKRLPLVGNITVSIGASIHTKEGVIEETIKRADENLYISKKSGRNRVTLL